MWTNQAGEKLIFRDEYDKKRETEPTIDFTDNKTLKAIVQFKSSGVFYNRDEYPHDTAKQAAKRMYEFVLPFYEQNQWSRGVNWTIKAWKEFPERRIHMFVDGGLQHNYDDHELDTWHWWFLNELSTLMKRVLR